jgi:quercetin dioxygenase-like cupin family protein
MHGLYNRMIFTGSRTKNMNNQLDNTELAKSKPHIIVEILEYIPNSILTKTIIKKTTGNITVTSLDAGEELAEKTSPFDTFIQIIDGTAQVEISDKKYKLRLGEGIIIPAHSSHCFNASEQFKMISTIIKSGYED